MENGGLELVTDREPESVSELPGEVHVAGVGTEGDQGGGGEVTLAVQEMGRVQAHFYWF